LSRYLDQETAKKPFGLRVKLPPITTGLLPLKGRDNAIPLSALPKDTSELARAYFRTIPLLLNVK